MSQATKYCNRIFVSMVTGPVIVFYREVGTQKRK